MTETERLRKPACREPAGGHRRPLPPSTHQALQFGGDGD